MTSINPRDPTPFPPRTLTTPRLALRGPEPAADAHAVVDHWAADPEVTRYLLFTTYTPGEYAPAEQFLGFCAANWTSGAGHRPWMICPREDDGRLGTPIGMIGITPGSSSHAYELSYVLGRAWWSQGLMTEAVRGLSEALLASPRVWRLFATIHVDHLASQRVLAKAGYQREGTLRRLMVFPGGGPEPQDCVVWSLTRDDVRATVAPAPLLVAPLDGASSSESPS